MFENIPTLVYWLIKGISVNNLIINNTNNNQLRTYNLMGYEDAAVWQPQRTYWKLNPRQSSRLFSLHPTRDRNWWTRNMQEFRFLGVGGNRSTRRKPTKADMELANQIQIQLNCSSTKPTRIASGVVCHSETERNRPYKIPWPCRELNRDLMHLKNEMILPVCHTTPSTKTAERLIQIMTFSLQF